jgi:NTP pyrophosphatase (non-canonical NTP hydrolase)
MDGSQTLVSRFLLPSSPRRREDRKGKRGTEKDLRGEKNMDIKQLTEEMNRFVHSKGWYEADSQRPQTPRNLAISLALEAAEILEHFQFREEAKDQKELADELADVALYLLQLASVTEIDLEKAILDKIEVNMRREWDEAE